MWSDDGREVLRLRLRMTAGAVRMTVGAVRADGGVGLAVWAVMSSGCGPAVPLVPAFAGKSVWAGLAGRRALGKGRPVCD